MTGEFSPLASTCYTAYDDFYTPFSIVVDLTTGEVLGRDNGTAYEFLDEAAILALVKQANQ